ncbi:T9SS type A sorting domain-containing protein [Winogradskyella echinorum]|uniref:T9SS type A sorting domain-containing protein n=1 Tax=Winogradskyella echinorum TaxID=538189 RepID=A0ABR6Y443_9FLAO|nr:T9SS type A sorting domain-containing protein [Winogradskyella echinorum]MBC3847023.1 T9SS type A sorting domain-containing protein [Winogradskyella echinorum]MBC5751371.1 T9SS type A sorting domain-containing protein [Winogradskyella echinorum]
MKKITLLINLLFTINLCAQIQISNFTFNNVSSSGPSSLQEFNGEIFFSANTDNYGRELWSSDGTSNNTNLIIDIAPGESNGLVTFFSAILNNELYFNANDNYDYSGGEIWKTDGSGTNSSLVTSYTGRLFGLTTVGNLIYFTIKTSNNNLQIWKSDGTQSGTTLVKDNIAIWNVPTFQGSINNTFIFTIQVPSTNNSKVWRSDGTSSGTFALTGEIDGNGSTGSTSDLSHYIVYNNNLYFITRYYLYKTDGTIANTSQVASVWNAQNNLVDFGDTIELNGKIYFLFYSLGLKKLAIYESDGTSSGTSEIYSVTGNAYFYPAYLNKSGNNLIFTSINTNNGTSLYYLNTNNFTLSEIIQIDESPQEPPYFLGNFSALSLDRLNDNLFFMSSPKDTFPEKKGWVFNETSMSLTPYTALDDLYEDYFGQKIIYNNDLYYSKNNQLWKFDTNSLSLSDVTNNEVIQVFPNPTSDFINFSQPETVNDIKVYDINGQLVIENQVLINDKLDVRNLNSGIYLIDFKKDNLRITKKIVIAK